MTDRKKSDHHKVKPEVRIAGKVFPDGSLLELVRTPNRELNFLIWNGESAETAVQFAKHGETFVPLRIDPTILRTLQLPSHAAEYGSTRKLFTEVFELISRMTHQGDGVVKPLTFFVFATWLADCFPLAPYLWIVAPPTTSAAPLAQMLGLLCRRPLIVNDISSAGFHAIPVDLQPTLITQVFEPTRRVLNLLRASSRHGALIAAGGESTDMFSAKIVFALNPPRDTAIAGFPLELVLSPAREYIPMMISSEAERIAEEYQSKLLQYRLSNRAKVDAPAFDLSQFTVPMQEIAHSLAGSVVDDDQLQLQIVPLLKPLDTEIRIDRTFQLPAIVLEGLLARCHTTTGMNFPVGDLTRDVNTILCGRGELLEVSPEDIGWALRGLGLHTHFMPGGRKGLILLNNVRKKIHELAAVYGVRTLRNLSVKIDCPFCAGLAAESKLEANPAGATVRQTRGMP